MSDMAPLWLPCLFGRHEWGKWERLRDGRKARRCAHCRQWEPFPLNTSIVPAKPLATKEKQ